MEHESLKIKVTSAFESRAPPTQQRSVTYRKIRMLDFVSYLLLVYLMTLPHVRLLTSKGRKCKGCERKRLCPIVRQNPYSGISVLGFIKKHETVSQNRCSPGQDLNPGPSKYVTTHFTDRKHFV